MEKGSVINRKIVLITGGNRGLGYGIIESLLERKTQLRVILTARNDFLGHKAYDTLCQTYPDEKDHFFYHQLDITKSDSISALLEWVKENFGKIDYLINNAGVFFRGSDFCLEIFNKTFEVNVYGTMNLTNEILVKDMINKGGKIINVGGRMGSLGRLTNKKLVDDFKAAKTEDDLLKLADQFKNAIINDTVEKDGWTKSAYCISKIIVNTYPMVLKNRKEVIENDISVFSCHPGWVKTDMGGEGAPLSIKEGAETEIFLITLPDGIHEEYQGKYFRDSKVYNFDVIE